jgi:hypothetical protein
MRVERLFQILRQSARPLNLGDPNRTGAGMPDAVNALLLPQPAREVGRPDELLQRLLAILEGSQAPPADRAAVLQQVLMALQQAGTTPMPAGVPARGVDLRLALKQLRAAMQQAGLLPSKGRRAALYAMQHPRGVGQAGAPQRPGGASAAAGSSAPGNGWPMRQLTETMRQAGLL